MKCEKKHILSVVFDANLVLLYELNARTPKSVLVVKGNVLFIFKLNTFLQNIVNIGIETTMFATELCKTLLCKDSLNKVV